jgi:hypothetical protein
MDRSQGAFKSLLRMVRLGRVHGYHIDTAPLLERPEIEATRIVWELPLEGTARELLSEAEGLGDDDKNSKIAEAMVFLKTALAHGERLGREVEEEAKKAGIAKRTLERAAKGTVGKRKAASGWYWWSLPSARPPSP